MNTKPCFFWKLLYSLIYSQTHLKIASQWHFLFFSEFRSYNFFPLSLGTEINIGILLSLVNILWFNKSNFQQISHSPIPRWNIHYTHSHFSFFLSFLPLALSLCRRKITGVSNTIFFLVIANNHFVHVMTPLKKRNICTCSCVTMWMALFQTQVTAVRRPLALAVWISNPSPSFCHVGF